MSVWTWLFLCLVATYKTNINLLATNALLTNKSHAFNVIMESYRLFL